MKLPLQLGVRSEATFDGPRKNRYVLRRIWNDSLPRVAFCLTNPSTADEELDDPTLRKVQTYARLWGFGSVEVVNAFSWRATNPKELRTRCEPETVLTSNLRFVRNAVDKSTLFVCGWGVNGTVDGRARLILQALTGCEVSALRLTKHGEPEHPLYLPSQLTPFTWTGVPA